MGVVFEQNDYYDTSPKYVEVLRIIHFSIGEESNPVSKLNTSWLENLLDSLISAVHITPENLAMDMVLTKLLIQDI
ncbi:hypothetical protein [Paenibacillus sp. 37]|uniref:hypothetical protein n=1 Tax=Paenibacillus sp. 37 TaxID=2607911 RepID=UPI001CB76668|nr:hypothetical protein [Paenibacillus sp. 37]